MLLSQRVERYRFWEVVAQWAEHFQSALEPGHVGEALLSAVAASTGAERASVMLVNPATAAGYLNADFTTVTPNEFLMQSAPATEVEHIVEAAMPDARIRKLLKIAASEPCLRLRRRTWSGSQIVSTATLWHPGHAHRFTTRFSYRADGTSKRTYL